MLALGIEGGGTKSELIITNIKGHVLYTCSFSALNLYTKNIAETLQSLNSAITTGLKSIKKAKKDIVAICIGSAGLGRDTEKQVLRQFLIKNNYTSNIKLLTDAEIALLANSTSGNSILVIAGTGSLAIAYDTAGNLQRCGGWGHLIGDEGSAYDIGRQALNSALNYYDEFSIVNDLLKAILNNMSLTKTSEIIPHIYLNPQKTKIASIAKVVNELALQGNKKCEQILNEAGHKLALLVTTLIKKMNYSQPITVLCQGSVLNENEIVFNTFKEELQKMYCNVVITKIKSPAVYGAVKIACSLIK